MVQSEDRRLADKLAGKGARAWRLDPDGRMEVIAADGRDLWFTADQVAAARKPAQPARKPKQPAKPAQPAKKPAAAAGKKSTVTRKANDHSGAEPPPRKE